MVKDNGVQLKTGIVLSYVQMFLSVIIGIIQSPIIIRCLGQSEYGLYNTIVSMLSMLTVLSLGFNSSYVRYYSIYKKSGDNDAIYRLNGLFLIIFLIIGLISLSCGLFLTYNLKLVFANGLTQVEYGIAKILMIILTFNVTLTFPMSVFQNIIMAHEKFIFFKLLIMVKTVLSPLITIPVVLMGYGSIGLAVITVGMSTAVDIAFVLFTLISLKQKFYFRNFEKGLFKSLFNFTFFIAINLIVDEVNTNLDKVLLSRYSGTVATAIYSVGFTLYNYYRLFSTSISGVFATRVHRIYNENKEDGVLLKKNLTDIFVKVGRIQFLVLSLIAMGFTFFGKAFIQHWVGEGYEESYYVGVLLIIPSTIALMQNVGLEIQRAQNKHKFRSLFYLGMAVVNVVLTIWLCQIYGAVGAAMGTAISFVLANGIAMNIYYHKACKINVLEFWKQILLMMRGFIIPVIVGILALKFINLTSIWLFLVSIVAFVIIYSLSMWAFGMNAYERQLIKKPLRRLFLKK